ncbi:MAG TPA: TonB-dependent receptor plug domain-containing protein [Sphingomicrobium sp.]|nr:TonB-dependent receptor plug domain-containing protein [Sphingomicrobium sp.]
MVRRTWLLAVGTSAAALAAPALAQAPATPPAGAPSGRTTVYDAAYFAQFAPRSAYDIVQHVPGFQLDLGAGQNGADVRGFAGTAGNVVINGARPSTKSEALDTTLQRIPAQRVVRVELGSGDLYGSDYAGKSQVLNVVLSNAGGLDANVTVGALRRYSGYVQKNISANALIRKGPSSFNLSAGTGYNKQYEEGTDTLVDTASGTLVEFRRKHNVYANKNPFIAAAYALEHGANDAYRINLRWQPNRFDLTQTNRVSPFDGPQHDDNLFQHYKDPVFELGGDVTRPLASGAIKLVGLATRRKRHDFDQYVQRDGLIDEGGVTNGGFDQLIDAKRNETIGRLSWTRANLLGLSFEAGAEAAYNTLDDHVELNAVDEDGNRVPIDLSIADATVKEKRGEVYVNLGKALSPTLRVDGGVNYEYSNLKVRGDAIADRTLKFLKPNITFDWKPGGGWHTQLSVKRTVAQLDFYDFISVGDLSTKRINGGNADLEPQRTWEFRATVEHPLFGDGLFKLDLGHDLVSKLQDRILICDEIDHPGDPDFCADAPGNLGTGRRYFASLTLDAPLAMLWKGLRAKLTGTIQRTRVEDPISGDKRNWSGFFPDWQWDLTVRRDSGSLSYGFELFDQKRTTFFRTDEFDSNFNGAPGWNAFVEYRPAANTSVTLNVDHVFGKRNRLLFRPNRADPSLIINEFRERDQHISVGLTLKQTFGSSGGAKVAKKD